jgi:cell division protein FtsB
MSASMSDSETLAPILRAWNKFRSVRVAAWFAERYTVLMKLAFAIALGVVVIFLGWNIFSFIRQERQLNQSLVDVQSRLAQAQSQEADLEAQTQYLSNPTNLEKQLRSQFNYTKPGETMIVIVPSQSSTAP